MANWEMLFVATFALLAVITAIAGPALSRWLERASQPESYSITKGTSELADPPDAPHAKASSASAPTMYARE